MKRLAKKLIWLLAVAAAAQDSPADRVQVAFSDPARPGTVKASLISGSITVKAHSGNDVIVEARTRSASSSSAPGGMKRIVVGGTGLSVSEESNVMSVGATSHSRTVDLTIQVPARTSLKLNCINSGKIEVEGVSGEIEASHHNGSVTLKDVAGSAIAHSHNGKVLVSMTRVEPNKPMSFSSWNGAVDLTFPADLKATVKLRTDRGDIFTDFDVAMLAEAKPLVEDTRSQNGKYRVRVDRTVTGTINGGGPEIQVKNYNGPIYIRKK
ncbi:MAG: DUF4097 family beta strand repeat-containing protein [Bryobacteraceae bacterium]